MDGRFCTITCDYRFELQIFKRPKLLHFSTDLDETGIKIHGLLRSFI